MAVAILVIIYLAFISMGLPDSLLGVTIPAIRGEWNLPLSMGSLLSIIVVGGSIFSSFISGIVIKKLGTGRIIFVSCAVTGLALLGFSLAPSILYLMILALPLGLGGGAIDSSLNNYVALNYKARHMNWLHSFWGVGATLGPVIMSRFLRGDSGSWQDGYRIISYIQLSFALVLLATLPLWKKQENKVTEPENNDSSSSPGFFKLLKTPGVGAALLTMMTYISVEHGVGLWGSSFLVSVRNITPDKAALWIAVYWGGIMIGRFFSGFLSMKLSNIQLIRYGIIMTIAGILLLLLPLPEFFLGLSLVLIGLGLSPIFPAMLHATPERFGREASQHIIGYQMGIGYSGSVIISPALGVIFQFTSMSILPFIVLVFAVAVLYLSERVNKKVGKTHA